jgi:hypothetical protein
MPKPQFPAKPAAPSVRETIGSAIERARGVPKAERAMTQKEVVEDILQKLNLPPSIRDDWTKRHGID